ncbi:MAG: hypothetical protein WAW75_10420 [Gallionella sp.]
MQKQDNFNTQDDGTTSDEISLTDILTPLWRSRWMILFVTLSVTAFGLAGSRYFVQYKSEGYFQFGGAIPAGKEPTSPGISLSDYKRYVATYATSERFADFVLDKKLESVAGIDNMSAVFASRDAVTKLIEPIYPFTKLDAKELMDQPKDSTNNIIGLRINYSSRSSEGTQQMVGLLGRYVMDSIIYRIYSDELEFKHGEMMAKMIRLDNDIIVNQELLKTYRRKGADLKQIVNRYPESSRQASRQVISVTEDNARYLSPVTLLVTTEVQASEAREAIRKAKREQKQSALLLDYYDRAKALLDQTKSGETILLGLEQVKEHAFKGRSLEDDEIKEVYNSITIANQEAINRHLEKSRFIAGPTLPAYSSPRRLFVLVASSMLGLFLSVLLVFARNWWRNNWLKVTG